MSYIFGYTNFIDGSARGVPAFYQMKSRETFAPIGPYLVTADEIPDPQKLAIQLWNNGPLLQDFNTDDMAHKIPRCIEWVTSIHTLEPATSWPPAPTTAGSTRSWTATRSSSRPRALADCASTSAMTCIGRGRARRACSGKRRVRTAPLRSCRASTRKRRLAETACMPWMRPPQESLATDLVSTHILCGEGRSRGKTPSLEKTRCHGIRQQHRRRRTHGRCPDHGL